MAASFIVSAMASRHHEEAVPSPFSNCSAAAAHSFAGSRLPRKQLKVGSVPTKIRSSSLWGPLAAKCGQIEGICDLEEVTVLRCTGTGKDSGIGEVAVKFIPKGQPNIRQVDAECLANTMLPVHPLLAKQIAIRQGKHGICMIGPYAGDSVEDLLGRSWGWLNIHIRIALARDMLACMLIALDVMGKLPEPQLYRDFKLANICYDARTRMFKLIDFGLMTPTSKRNFFAGSTPTYIDPQFAREYQGVYAWCSEEGQAAFTTAALDIYTLCLAALRLILQVLPPALHYYHFVSRYEPCPMSAFLESLAAWDPTACAELTRMPDAQCRDFLTIGLAFNPEDRFNVAQAMQHPFVAQRVTEIQAELADATPAWKQQEQHIRSMYPNRLSGSEGECASSDDCCSPRGPRGQLPSSHLCSSSSSSSSSTFTPGVSSSTADSVGVGPTHAMVDGSSLNDSSGSSSSVCDDGGEGAAVDMPPSWFGSIFRRLHKPNNCARFSRQARPLLHTHLADLKHLF